MTSFTDFKFRSSSNRKVMYGPRIGNDDKGPQPTQDRKDASNPGQASGAGVPAPGTYQTGTGPTVRPENTGIMHTGQVPKTTG